MRPRWTGREVRLLLPGAVLCGMALAWPHVPLPQLLGGAALLAMAGIFIRRRLAMRGGGLPGNALPPMNVELFSRQAVVTAGDRMLQACRARRCPLSVAVVELRDLPEVHALFGATLAEQVARRVAVRLQALAADRGLAERTSPTQFSVLLPGMDAAAARRALHAAFGDAGAIDYECGRDELLLLPDFHVAEVPDSACVLDIYAHVCACLTRTQAQAARQPVTADAYGATVPVPL